MCKGKTAYVETNEKQIIDRIFNNINTIKRALVLTEENKFKGQDSDPVLEADLLKNLLSAELNVRRLQSCVRGHYE